MKCTWDDNDVNNVDDMYRDADKRAALAAKAKEKDDVEKKEQVRPREKDETATITTLEVDTSRTEKKRSETEVSIPSLPKAPSLQSHPHIFKDRKKVDRVVTHGFCTLIINLWFRCWKWLSCKNSEEFSMG